MFQYITEELLQETLLETSSPQTEYLIEYIQRNISEVGTAYLKSVWPTSEKHVREINNENCLE